MHWSYTKFSTSLLSSVLDYLISQNFKDNDSHDSHSLKLPIKSTRILCRNLSLDQLRLDKFYCGPTLQYDVQTFNNLRLSIVGLF